MNLNVIHELQLSLVKTIFLIYVFQRLLESWSPVTYLSTLLS